MSCLPCDSAVHLFCVCRAADHQTHRCGWDHTWDLNPDNPRSADNEKRHPVWLVGDFGSSAPAWTIFLMDDWQHFHPSEHCCEESPVGFPLSEASGTFLTRLQIAPPSPHILVHCRVLDSEDVCVHHRDVDVNRPATRTRFPVTSGVPRLERIAMDLSDGLFLGGFLGIVFLFFLIFIVISVLPLWVVFKKMGYPGWWAIIPFFNSWKIAEAAGRPGFWGLVGLLAPIPVLGWVIVLVVWFFIMQDLSRSFGKDAAWAILLTLLPWFGFLALALMKDAVYQGPAGPEPQHYRRAV